MARARALRNPFCPRRGLQPFKNLPPRFYSRLFSFLERIYSLWIFRWPPDRNTLEKSFAMLLYSLTQGYGGLQCQTAPCFFGCRMRQIKIEWAAHSNFILHFERWWCEVTEPVKYTILVTYKTDMSVSQMQIRKLRIMTLQIMHVGAFGGKCLWFFYPLPTKRSALNTYWYTGTSDEDAPYSTCLSWGRVTVTVSALLVRSNVQLLNGYGHPHHLNAQR